MVKDPDYPFAIIKDSQLLPASSVTNRRQEAGIARAEPSAGQCRKPSRAECNCRARADR